MADLQALRSRIDRKTVRCGDKGCIFWDGAVDSGGYGRMYVYFDDRRPKKLRVHRLVYSLHHFDSVDLPSKNDRGCKVEISHLCHEPRCCNVNHMSLETHQVNMSRLFCKRTGLCTGHQIQSHDGGQRDLPRCIL